MTLTRLDDQQAKALEQVIIGGDLASLSAAERMGYYHRVCQSLRLNPYTKPFAYIKLNGKLVLYALRDAADQLRAIHKLSVEITSRETLNDVYVVTARATTPDGRSDESIGAVSIKGLLGEALANAYMKTETKAKRRVTLSIAGLGWLDETEVDTIPQSRVIDVDTATGEIKDSPALPPPAGSQQRQPPPRPAPAQQERPVNRGGLPNQERLASFGAMKEAREALGLSETDFVAHVASNYGDKKPGQLTLDEVAEITQWLRDEKAMQETSEAWEDAMPPAPGLDGVRSATH